MQNIEEKKYWVWLSLIDGLSAKKTQKLLEKYKHPKNIIKLSKDELLKIEGIGEILASKILDNKIKKTVINHINYMQKNNIDIITIYDKKYPKILKEIYDPPSTLYLKGNSDILNNTNIGIIGCRDASNYGTKAAKYFAYNLAKEKINIVSGLAKGIDSSAHIGALATKGNTIAVVGTGLDMVYPNENKELEKEIIRKNGTIISEYPLGTKPEKNNFPARNRIISGLSKALIVVEAKEKSGTLITVDYALEQGREVFAVPGNINSINSVGTNNLINQGAIPICNYTDVLNSVNHSWFN